MTGFDNGLKDASSNKNELNELLKKVKALSTKGLTNNLMNKFSILNGAKYFSLGIFENYLVFISAKKYIKYFSGTTRIESWKYIGMSAESIENITKSGSSFAPAFVDHYLLPDENFNGHCLIKNNITPPKRIMSLYTSYKLTPWSRNLDKVFPLDNSLFGSVKLTKNAHPDKYKYSGYGIGFDSRSEFLLSHGGMGRTIFGADMSLSVHVDLNSWRRTNTRIRSYYINS